MRLLLGLAGIAAAFEIGGETNVFGPGMFVGEGGGAEHAFLFAVGEQEDDVVVERRACPQSSHGFEQRRHSGTIVASFGRQFAVRTKSPVRSST